MSSWRLLHLTSRYQTGVVVLMTLACFAFWPAGVLAVFVGGAFSGLNFLAMKSLVARMFQNPAARAKIVYGSLLAFKMAAALGVMAVAIVFLQLDPIGFALGLSSMLIGFGAAMAHTVLRPVAPTT